MSTASGSPGAASGARPARATQAHEPLPPAGEHGGDAWAVAASLGVHPAALVDLSASTNPFAPDVASLVAHLATEHPELVTRYPDDTTATNALAATLGVDPGIVVLTNGGAEAIALVAHLEPAGHVVDPEFSLYRRHLRTVDEQAPRWRSNPSNPLGRLAASGEQASVWDEAFYPLATGRWTRGDTGAWRLGSLTKLWACPGLRLGYAIAPTPADAAALRRIRPQWAVNGLALGALPELLAQSDLPRWATEIAALRAEFTVGLRALGFTVEPTEANWVLVARADLRATLAPHGVLVRDCASFGLPDLARVALPRPEQLGQVLAAFARIAS